MLQTKIKILANKKIAPEYYKMALESPEIVRTSTPGQFLHIRVSNNSEPLLRRPFGIHSIKDTGEFEILYRVVGKGTALLSKKKAEEELDVLGPLGNGFKFPVAGNETMVLIGGGAGIAPLFFLAQKAHHLRQIIVLIGGKTKDQVLCEEEFKKLGIEVRIATEDGSYGHKGLVTDLLNALLHTSLSIFACGPLPMQKRISIFSSEHNLSCQVSLESRMACGIGACLGCAIKVKGESTTYKRVCIEGPVFEAKEIMWE
ncbi:MAG: dihydroorotate dehydrogenase electron transfer subunit [bacterium]|nr:dihydroorotate dehydrogenase electron transfer subunit [bacterium]